jgi:anhydro-N-acetylmuramic acid kinase
VIQPIDDYGINGDFVESQAFAFLAIRSILKLPISFPDTTGCLKACSGGELIKN